MIFGCCQRPVPAELLLLFLSLGLLFVCLATCARTKLSQPVLQTRWLCLTLACVCYVDAYLPPCRDGTVFSAVSVSDLSQSEQLYRKLGAKLVVGMPFKDIATSDSIFMRQVCDYWWVGCGVRRGVDGRVKAKVSVRGARENLLLSSASCACLIVAGLVLNATLIRASCCFMCVLCVPAAA